MLMDAVNPGLGDRERGEEWAWEFLERITRCPEKRGIQRSNACPARELGWYDHYCTRLTNEHNLLVLEFFKSMRELLHACYWGLVEFSGLG